MPTPHPHISGQEQVSVENRNGQEGGASHVDVIKMFVGSRSEVQVMWQKDIYH